jgi:hypothetical protein
MKKISTRVGKQCRKISEQKLTIGLDLGDRWSWYCLLDEVGEVVQEQKLGTTPKAMKEVFGGMPRSRIALETGMAIILPGNIGVEHLEQTFGMGRVKVTLVDGDDLSLISSPNRDRSEHLLDVTRH